MIAMCIIIRTMHRIHAAECPTVMSTEISLHDFKDVSLLLIANFLRSQRA